MGIKNDPRHNSRKIALSTLFSELFDSEIEQHTKILDIKDILELDLNDKSLLEDILKGVATNKEKTDALIQKCAPDWPLDKIAKIDITILRIAIFEILYSDKVSHKIAIDEAVELAKEFGSDTSPKFINGVLGTIVDKHLDKKENLDKSDSD